MNDHLSLFFSLSLSLLNMTQIIEGTMTTGTVIDLKERTSQDKDRHLFFIYLFLATVRRFFLGRRNQSVLQTRGSQSPMCFNNGSSLLAIHY